VMDPGIAKILRDMQAASDEAASRASERSRAFAEGKFKEFFDQEKKRVRDRLEGFSDQRQN